MPCQDPYPGQYSAEKVNDLTRLLCEAAGHAEAHGFELPESVRAWWTEHKKVDAARKEAEDRARRERVEHLRSVDQARREQWTAFGRVGPRPYDAS